jgi:hypothetical protein
VIGGHSQIGLRLLRLLAHDGRHSRGVIRKSLVTTRPCWALTARPPQPRSRRLRAPAPAGGRPAGRRRRPRLGPARHGLQVRSWSPMRSSPLPSPTEFARRPSDRCGSRVRPTGPAAPGPTGLTPPRIQPATRPGPLTLEPDAPHVTCDERPLAGTRRQDAELDQPLDVLWEDAGPTGQLKAESSSTPTTSGTDSATTRPSRWWPSWRTPAAAASS